MLFPRPTLYCLHAVEPLHNAKGLLNYPFGGEGGFAGKGVTTATIKLDNSDGPFVSNLRHDGKTTLKGMF